MVPHGASGTLVLTCHELTSPVDLAASSRWPQSRPQAVPGCDWLSWAEPASACQRSAAGLQTLGFEFQVSHGKSSRGSAGPNYMRRLAGWGS